MDELFFDKKKYLSTRRTSYILGYSKDYIGRFCREKKLNGRRVKNAWYIEESSIYNFQKIHELEKKRKAEVLRKSRQIEYQKKNNLEPKALVKFQGLVPALIASLILVVVAALAYFALINFSETAEAQIKKWQSQAQENFEEVSGKMQNQMGNVLGSFRLEEEALDFNFEPAFETFYKSQKGLEVSMNFARDFSGQTFRSFGREYLNYVNRLSLLLESYESLINNSGEQVYNGTANLISGFQNFAFDIKNLGEEVTEQVSVETLKPQKIEGQIAGLWQGVKDASRNFSNRVYCLISEIWSEGCEKNNELIVNSNFIKSNNFNNSQKDLKDKEPVIAIFDEEDDFQKEIQTEIKSPVVVYQSGPVINNQNVIEGVSESDLVERLRIFEKQLDLSKGETKVIYRDNFVRQTDVIFENFNNNINSVISGGSSNFSGASLSVTGNISSGGIIIATSFVGDGSGLTGIYSLPDQTGNGGKYLTTDGTDSSWAAIIPAATSTDDLSEGLNNLYFTAQRARDAFGTDATGLAYATSTGIFSLASGFEIPTTASTTDWNSKVSSRWGTNGIDIYYNGGNVGIGTISPSEKLTVLGNGLLTGSVTANSFIKSGGTSSQFLKADGSVDSSTYLKNNIGISGGTILIGGTGTTDDLILQTTSGIGTTGADIIFRGGNNGGTEFMRILNSGNVGVGIASPTSKLHVKGSPAGSGNYLMRLENDTAWNGNEPYSLYVNGYTYLNGFRISGSGTRGIYLVSGNMDFATNNGDISFTSGGLGTLERMRISASTGNVGIGTTTPNAKFVVVDGTNTFSFNKGQSNITPNISLGTSGGKSLALLAGSSGTSFTYDSTGFFAISGDTKANIDGGSSNGGMIRMVVTSGGNVGIGSDTSPSSRLSVSGGATIGGSYYSTFAPANGLVVEGNVGIGTTSPSQKLDVWGGMRVGTGDNPLILVDDISGNVGINMAPLSPFSVQMKGSSPINGFRLYEFGLAAFWSFNRTNDGNLLIARNGTTGIKLGGTGFVGIYHSDFSTLIRPLTVRGHSSLGIAAFVDSSGVEKVTITNDAVGIGTTTPSEKLHVEGNARFTSVGSGAYAYDLNLTSTGVLTTSASDIALKNNIKSLDTKEMLEKLNELNPATFNWKNDESNKKDFGLIAQEVEEIFPELVFTNPSDGYKGINYSRFTAIIISSIQEISNRLQKIIVWFGDDGDSLNIQGEVCVDDVCVSKEDFKALILQAGGNSIENQESNNNNNNEQQNDQSSDNNSSGDSNNDKDITDEEPEPEPTE